MVYRVISLIIYCLVFRTQLIRLVTSFCTVHVLAHFCMRGLCGLMSVEIYHFRDNFVHMSSAILSGAISCAFATELQTCVRMSVIVLQI
jgi:hypothetical protein